MMKNLIPKLTGLLFLSVLIRADKLPSETDITKIKNDDYSLFASSPTSEELQIPKYLSFEELNTLEDIFGSFSDLDLQSYLPPSSSLSDFSPPSPQNAYSAPSFHSGNSAHSTHSGQAAPPAQPGHSAPSVQSSYTAVPAVKTDSFALFDSPKEGKQLGSPFGSFSDSYSSIEVSKNSPNSLTSHHGHSGGGGGYDKASKGMPYEFGYAVKDEYTKNDYGHKETSNGDVVTGEYRVLLPDGRTQIVSYTADHVKGYQANVRYEGEAKYPEPSPKHNYGAQQGKQLQQSYNSLGQEGKQEPYKQFQLQNPLPLESHSRDLPEQTFDAPKPQQSYSHPQPQQSHSSVQLQQNFIPPQPQSSYSPPHQSLQTRAPPKLQIKKYTPPKSQQNHNSSPIKQVVILSQPQQSYSSPNAQQSFASPQQTNLQHAFDPPKPQESYTQPILQESYSVPEPRHSFSQQNYAPALHQQGFIIPQPQQSYSSSELQQNFVLPEHPHQSFLEPQYQQSSSSSETQQGFVLPQPIQSFEIPHPQTNPSSSESRETINAASIALYLPPSQGQSVQDSSPQLDTSYLPPTGSPSGSPHRKRSAASALYRKSSPTVVVKRSQKIPLQFESLKNNKNSKKENDSVIR